MQFLEGGAFAPNAPSWIRHCIIKAVSTHIYTDNLEALWLIPLEATRGSAGRSHGSRVMNARTQIIVEKIVLQ